MFRKLSALIASTSLSDCISFSCCSYTPNSLLAATSYHPSPTVCALLPSHPSSGQVFSRRGQNQLVKFNTRLFQTRDISSTPERATLESIAESLKSGHYKRILVVAGAGISCSAGIPDFRTPGSGLYDNLHKFNLPYAEAIFDLDFYRNDPHPFITLSKEIWPGVKYRPTLTHSFFSLLDKKGILHRIYTQNIDGLEAVAGVNPDKLVECHGHFRSASCIKCQAPHDADQCKSSILEKGEAPSCNSCGGFVKPDIVFYGEVLPMRFIDLVHDDVDSCDLLMVLGTSLLVAPVANIPLWVSESSDSLPRVLVNRELAGDFRKGKLTDVFVKGDCDDSVRKLCQLAGWEADLDQIYHACHNN